jgi:hypothetical protein
LEYAIIVDTWNLVITIHMPYDISIQNPNWNPSTWKEDILTFMVCFHFY